MLKTFILTLLVVANPVNESFLGVECFPEQGIIKACLNLEYNDFVFDYRYAINDDQHFEPSGQIDTTKILVGKYLELRVKVYADGEMLKGQLTNIESAGGKLKLDFLYYFNKRAKQFRVKNVMFTEYNEDQSNLLIFKYKDIEEGVLLTPERPERTFRVK